MERGRRHPQTGAAKAEIGSEVGKMSVIHFNSKGQTSREATDEEIQRIVWEKAETRRREERARKARREKQRERPAPHDPE